MCCSPWGCKESDTTEQLNNDMGTRRETVDPPGAAVRGSNLSTLCWTQALCRSRKDIGIVRPADQVLSVQRGASRESGWRELPGKSF